MTQCLICKSSKITKQFDCRVSITSFSMPTDLPVEVYLCEDCGHIFSHPSQLPRSFYEEDYELLLDSKKSEFVIFEGEEEKTLFDKVVHFIFQSIDVQNLDESFHVLEVGAGKGMLLKRLKELVNRPISISAVEPNQKSEPFLKNNLLNHEISMTTLENSPFKDRIFSLIMSHGVLEHVFDPVDFLKNICACMGQGSLLYIGVPNFIANPADVLTTDHLSKFTPTTIKFLFDLVGLEILASNTNNNQVFMTYILCKATNKSNDLHFQENVIASRKILNSALHYIDVSLKAFGEAIKESVETNKPLYMYGAGNTGLFAMKYLNVDGSNIKGIYDDNSTFWGTSRVGIPIKDPQKLSGREDSVIYISANTCYHQIITKKINVLTNNKASVYPKFN